MNKKSELIKNTLILGLGKASTQLLSFFLLPIYTIYLSTSEYGTTDLALTYVYLLVPTLTLQMEMAVFRFLIDNRNNFDQKRAIISNAIQIICTSMLCIIIVFAILNMFLDIKYGWYIVANICATIFSSFFLQTARGLGNNKKYAQASILTGIATVIATLLLVAHFNMGVKGVLLSITLANMTCFVYLLAFTNIKRYISINHSSKIKKELVRYSLPLVPNGVSFWVVSTSNRTILSLLINTAANGIYAVSNKFSMITMNVFGIFNMSWTESISIHIKDDKSHEYISDIINSAIKIFSFIGMTLLATTPFVFNLLIDESYTDAIKYIPIVAIGCIFNIVVSMYGAIYVAQKETIKVAHTTIIAAILNIILTIILVWFMGLYGAAIASTLSYFILMWVRYFDIKKSIAIKYDKVLILGTTASYIMVCIFYYIATTESYAICLLLAIALSTFACRKELRYIIANITKRLYNSK